MAFAARGEIQTCTHAEACDTEFVVESSGDVYPCDFFVRDSWKLGNIYDFSFKDMQQSRLYRKFNRKKLTVLPSECRSCSWLQLCRGGCLKHRPPLRPLLPGFSAGYGQNQLCPGEKMFWAEAVPKMKSNYN